MMSSLDIAKNEGESLVKFDYIFLVARIQLLRSLSWFVAQGFR